MACLCGLKPPSRSRRTRRPIPGSNPTSGGISGRRVHTFSAGDTLHSVAYAEYGNPGLWRVLAEANGVDDPLRIAPGTALLIPPDPHSVGP